MRLKWFVVLVSIALCFALTSCSKSKKKKKAGPVGFAVATATLANGTVAQAYSQSLTTTIPGTAPLTWAVTTGSLPLGLSLNATTGAITGAPTTAATSNFTVTVTDSTAGTPLTASRALSITIAAATSPVSITNTSLVNGQTGVAYSQTIAATGGTAPYTFGITASSSLPAGLTLNSTSGAVFGTPTATGTTVITFTVTDSAGTPNTAAKTLSITVNAGPAASVLAVSTTALPDGRDTVTYTRSVAATGGRAPYSWALEAGSNPLPTGLAITGGGIITGTPSAVGSFDFTVEVTDADASVATADLTITIGAAPAPGDDSWTIIVYGHGDHNLEPSLIADIDEMEAALAASAGTETFNIVVQIDLNSVAGCERWLVQADGGAGLSAGTTTDLMGGTPLGELNMDDPAVLQAFIEYAMATFPAAHYGLVMWNHGGQWDGGFGGDEDNGAGGAGDTLSPAEMTTAITAALATASVPKLDFMCFDTCLMGSAELYVQFAQFCDTYIACPEIDFGAGWDYAATFQYLHENPTDPMRDFGATEVVHWQAHHNTDTNDLALRAHAAYDSGQVDALVSAINEFATRLNQTYATESELQRTARRQAIQYRYGDISELGAPMPYVDLGHFALRVAALSSTAAMDDACNNLVAAINGCVLAKSLGTENAAALALDRKSTRLNSSH